MFALAPPVPLPEADPVKLMSPEPDCTLDAVPVI